MENKLKKILNDLEFYPNKGSFKFNVNDTLSSKCNIPLRKDISGSYIFYYKKEIVYIGISGRLSREGFFVHRKDGLRGRLLNGKQFGDRRSKTLSIQMQLEKMLSLEIHWFVTYGDNFADIPRDIESSLINAFKEQNGGSRPRWNKKD